MLRNLNVFFRYDRWKQFFSRFENYCRWNPSQRYNNTESVSMSWFCCFRFRYRRSTVLATIACTSGMPLTSCRTNCRGPLSTWCPCLTSEWWRNSGKASFAKGCTCESHIHIHSHSHSHSWFHIKTNTQTCGVAVRWALITLASPRASWRVKSMMTLCSGNTFRVTGPLWGESIGRRWISLTKCHQRCALMFTLMFSWTNWWNSCVGGDLIRHDVHVTSL